MIMIALNFMVVSCVRNPPVGLNAAGFSYPSHLPEILTYVLPTYRLFDQSNLNLEEN